MSQVSRRQYTDLYGPTTGDRFRLADTDLVCQVERSLITPGSETVYGGGKTIRDGMGQTPGMTSSAGTLDTVITNVIVMDPMIGVIKADIGIKDGRIVGLGNAGNPFLMDHVDPNLIVGAGTEAINGEGLIATAGAIDTHVHLLTPEQIDHALTGGFTTLIGGGVGPSDGSKGVTSTPGPWHLARMFEACEALPINIGFLGKGNSSLPATLREQLDAGACGLKVHEDWGSTGSVIDCALSVAEEYGVQVSIHTDTLNESGYLEDTISAINGRSIHSFHTEGAGGGHAPDIIAIASLPNVLPASTNPTRPFAVNNTPNLLWMTMVTHRLSPNNPEDLAFAQSRIRDETQAAEDVLHDIGALSMYSSDSQAMGRVGETFTRCIQTADKMKKVTGPLPGDSAGNDNFRVLRYLAKLTVNPARAQGIDHVVGSLEPGKLADIVLWNPSLFGVRPKTVIKGGLINWSIMGDPNASIPTPEPVIYRPAFGYLGKAAGRTSVTFMSQAAVDADVPGRLRLDRSVVAVRNCRGIQKQHMVRNDATPEIRVDPETYKVYVDGQLATVPPAETLALTQLYNVV